jgi:dTDP-4-dehydrorhamnose reductase
MPVVITGSTGMLGQALIAEANYRGIEPIGVARKGADFAFDLLSTVELIDMLETVSPSVIINTAALVSLDSCESDQSMAYAINAQVVSVMADWCNNNKCKLVQISTDHWYQGDGQTLHDESAPVRILNEYARSKYAGEKFALTSVGGLVIRTNITGNRGWPDRPTFSEWAIESILTNTPLTLFYDFFTSTIDTPTFSRVLFDMIEVGASGVYNVACLEVASKDLFIRTLAKHLEHPLAKVTLASVQTLKTPRACSLGLDVGKVQKLLGYTMPDLETVSRSLIKQHKKKNDI